MLTRRAGAEIAIADNNFSLAKRWLIEDEVCFLAACGIKSAIMEEKLLIAFGAQLEQKARRDQLIDIDILLIQRHGQGR